MRVPLLHLLGFAGGSACAVLALSYYPNTGTQSRVGDYVSIAYFSGYGIYRSQIFFHCVNTTAR